MRKYLFIVNPVAGRGRSKELIPKIEELFEKKGVEYCIKTTERVGHGEDLARIGADEGYTHIISVGGDGTIYEVLNGLKGRNVVLGVLPTGTGNDFIRTINLPSKVEDVLLVIMEGKTEKIDIGKVNDKHFINVLSVGIDAEITKETERIKKYISGTTAYIIGVFKTLIKYRSKEVEIFIDGKEYKRDIELIAIGNGKYYGGGMKITPYANATDGCFEICLINKLNKFKLAALFPTVFAGKHIKIKEVEIFKGRDIKIKSNEPMIINGDGNIIGVTPAHVTIESLSQEIIVP